MRNCAIIHPLHLELETTPLIIANHQCVGFLMIPLLILVFGTRPQS